MSTATNMDEKVLLKYICQTLNNWGITYITKEVLKKAKDNDAQAI